MIVKDFLSLETPNIVMLQETKRKTSDKRFVGNVWKFRNKKWDILSTCGTSRGIVMIWDSNEFNYSKMVFRPFLVTIKLSLDKRESFGPH